VAGVGVPTAGTLLAGQRSQRRSPRRRAARISIPNPQLLFG